MKNVWMRYDDMSYAVGTYPLISLDQIAKLTEKIDERQTKVDKLEKVITTARVSSSALW